MAQIHVVGHKNPDNDSIMAAWAVARLENAIDPGNDYVACRQGELPAESALVFEEQGVEPPVLKTELFAGEKVFLVDHNEKGQTIDGLDGAELVGVVDHHRIADISTASPVFFVNLPWGSTATIAAHLYEAYGVEVDAACAAVLLSAILTDTVILKSPTTTDADRETAEKLAQVAGVDVVEYGMRLFKSRGGDDGVSEAEICGRDAKEFNFGGKKVWVAQYETTDIEGLRAREDAIAAQVGKVCADGGFDAALMLLTDILQEGSDFLGAGDVSFIEEAFGIDLSAGAVWMPGVMSRKKQVAAVLIEKAGN